MRRTYDPQSPQKCLSTLFPLAALALYILGVPFTVMSLVGMARQIENLFSSVLGSLDF
jgi:hypothetical protein